MRPRRAQAPYLESVPESLPRRPPKRLQSGLAAATREELVVLVGCLASVPRGWGTHEPGTFETSSL
jgi:hypothetical protein